ncbi:MAG: tRNA (adenosine(37)-N6)-threonylcarbamoyltransferase complex ATPase subunit type 1 TsaE [Candidatus Aminicenantes bacterium]|nr:tRNA (adenosine(37)-N6)-threonylcarbamoyltransferase complex ATPase subunit type 1 TsaE [Candidatus Aminicenantes bacterium]
MKNKFRFELKKNIYFTCSEKETFELGQSLGEYLKGDEVILLVGELGAGKTVFTKGIAAGLQVEDVNQVCSPSFTLMNIYKARVPMIHLDLYRLNNGDEIADLGWEDYIGEAVIVVEWGEKIHYEASAIQVYLEVQDDFSRKISIERN